MDLLRDIAEIIKEDREHNLEVKVNCLGVTVYLDYDPDRDMKGKCIIPIHYDSLYESVCIPQDELVEKFKPSEGGIELGEIKLILKILKYMEKNKEELNILCSFYDLFDRHNINKNLQEENYL